MRIIYVHHALREKSNPPTQNDDIQPLGVKDAEIVAELLKQMASYCKFKAIYTSPYLRCARTAEIINKYTQVPVFEDARFNEFQNVYELVKNGVVTTETESWLDCQIRIREAIKDIVFKYDDKDTVVCVTSGVNIAAFISLAFKIAPSSEMPFPLVPSCSPIGFNIDKTCFDD